MGQSNRRYLWTRLLAYCPINFFEKFLCDFYATRYLVQRHYVRKEHKLLKNNIFI
jgi:hypothetical protein